MDFSKFIPSVKETLTQKYACYTGRADRQEFWFFALFVTAISLVLVGIAQATGIQLFQWISQIFCLATFVPYVCVTIRRLHDIGKPTWWVLMPIIPVVGIFALIYFLAKPSQA